MFLFVEEAERNVSFGRFEGFAAFRLLLLDDDCIVFDRDFR